EGAFAGENGVDRGPVGLIEVCKVQILDDGAGIAQFCNCRLERKLLLGLRPRPFCKAHDREPRLLDRRQSLFDENVKHRHRPAVPVAPPTNDSAKATSSMRRAKKPT